MTSTSASETQASSLAQGAYANVVRVDIYDPRMSIENKNKMIQLAIDITDKIEDLDLAINAIHERRMRLLQSRSVDAIKLQQMKFDDDFGDTANSDGKTIEFSRRWILGHYLLAIQTWDTVLREQELRREELVEDRYLEEQKLKRIIRECGM